MVILSNNSKTFNSIFDFVNNFGKDMPKKFKKMFKVSINKWKFEQTDQEAICDLLEQEKEKYIVMFIEDGHDGFFQIIEVED